MNTPFPADSADAHPVEQHQSDPRAEGSSLMGLATLTGTKIVNYEHETLGTVEDVMLDLDQGRISYAVMRSGGFLRLGEKHFAIPWGVLEVDRERRCLVLDADVATFQNAPGFNPGRWIESQPDENNWQDDVTMHYKAGTGAAARAAGAAE